MSGLAAVFGPGTHLAYVAPAYLISGAVLAALALDTLLRARRWRRRAEAAERARER